MLFEVGIGSIGIQLDGHIAAKPEVYLLRQGHGHYPIVSLNVKIHLSSPSDHPEHVQNITGLLILWCLSRHKAEKSLILA